MPGAVAELVITEQAGAEAKDVCEDLLRRSRARCVLLLARDGGLLDKFGFAESLDAQAAAALASACYSSTEALAELLGDSDLRMFYQQGANQHIQIHRVGDSALMVVVFDERTNAGLVRLAAEAASEQLVKLLTAPRGGDSGQEPAPSDHQEASPPGPRKRSTRSRKRS